MRKPFYFTQKKCWYVKDSKGKLLRLDPDEGEAYRIWQNMRDAASPLNHPHVTVGALVQQWLDEHEPQLSEDRFYKTGNYLGQFVDGVGVDFRAREITPVKVLR